MPNGTELDKKLGACTAEIEYTLSDSGKYTVLASDHDKTDTGNYYIYFQRLNNPGNDTAINFGEIYFGNISTPAQTDTYTFTANAMDVVLIYMSEETSGSILAPEIRLYAPNGTELDKKLGACTAEIEYTLSDSGKYTVLASDHDKTDTGNYYIYFQRLNNPGNDTAINFGEIYFGNISTPAQTDTYTFTANAMDVVLIYMSEETSGSILAPEIRLYAPNGTELDKKLGACTAEIEYTLSDSGKYTVLASDHDKTDTGNYYIYFQRLNNPGNDTAINFGEIYFGNISTPAQTDTYTFTANAMDVVLIYMSEETSGSILAPEIRLYAPNGTELDKKLGACTAEIEYTLSDSGKYTVLASDHDKTDTGNYFINFERLSGNNPPNKPICEYDRNNNEIVVSANDPDGDKIRYGISWNNNQIVDIWTNYYYSSEKIRIDCDGHSGTVGIIAEDELHAQSGWVSVTPKNKEINSLFLRILEQHQHMFPLLRQIMGL